MSYYTKKLKAINDCLKESVYPIVFDKKRWKKIVGSCYPYLLDIPVSDPKKRIWYPGCLSDESVYKDPNIYSQQELEERLYNDLDAMNFSYRKDSSRLRDGEYRGFIYLLPPKRFAYPKGFHFIREDNDGTLSNKPGWKKEPCIVDPNSSIMKDHYNRYFIKTIILRNNNI
jgi:hypothetical protein